MYIFILVFRLFYTKIRIKIHKSMTSVILSVSTCKIRIKKLTWCLTKKRVLVIWNYSSMYNGNDGLSSPSKNDPSNLATRNKENYLNPISYLMQIKPQLTQVLLICISLLHKKTQVDLYFLY